MFGVTFDIAGPTFDVAGPGFEHAGPGFEHAGPGFDGAGFDLAACMNKWNKFKDFHLIDGIALDFARQFDIYLSWQCFV